MQMCFVFIKSSSSLYMVYDGFYLFLSPGKQEACGRLSGRPEEALYSRGARPRGIVLRGRRVSQCRVAFLRGKEGNDDADLA